MSKRRIVALCGGVGGAKLVCGLAQELAPEELLIVANTGDDFEHLGLSICPDLDSVMYALAGENDESRGWGLRQESWRVMQALEQRGGESWFALGDRDLATHILRSADLRAGLGLTAATARLCAGLGVAHQLLPMSDDAVRTRVLTAAGELAFQHYFVREQCKPEVRGFRFDGVDSATPHPELMAWLAAPTTDAVVICPSNPFVSIDPLLSLPGLRAALRASRAPVIAISPIVGGAALKGPAAKMLEELGHAVSALGVARWYGDLLDAFVLDQRDENLASSLAGGGVKPYITETLMTDINSKRALARTLLDIAADLAGPRAGTTPDIS